MEVASTYSKIAVEQLLNIHALTCMGRAAPESSAKEYFASAKKWLPQLEQTIQSLKLELERRTS